MAAEIMATSTTELTYSFVWLAWFARASLKMRLASLGADLIQTAMSFSAMQILVVGAPKLDSALLTDIPHKRFQNLPECATYITLTLKADLVGVEIMEDKTKCFNIDTLPFTRDTAFMLGNEGSGMNEKQLAICDYFVYISQFGHGTASLNVNVAAGVVLQRFDDWRRR